MTLLLGTRPNGVAEVPVEAEDGATVLLELAAPSVPEPSSNRTERLNDAWRSTVMVGSALAEWGRLPLRPEESGCEGW